MRVRAIGMLNEARVQRFDSSQSRWTEIGRVLGQLRTSLRPPKGAAVVRGTAWVGAVRVRTQDNRTGPAYRVPATGVADS
jgi:hypothetical protein